MEKIQKMKLEEWMLTKGFTQRSLAREAGISHTILSLVISGDRTNIRSDTRGKIARAMGLEIRQVIEFNGMIEKRLRR